MALALSSVSRSTVRPAAPRVQRKPLPPARFSIQEAVDSVTDGFLRIFSKPNDQDVKWSSNEFKGKISHHGPGRPFKDGYQAGGQKYAVKQEGEQPVAQPEAGEGSESYLGGAVQNLVAHNFTGDETTAPPETTGASGWKGDIHDRKREGFHARKV